MLSYEIHVPLVSTTYMVQAMSSLLSHIQHVPKTFSRQCSEFLLFVPPQLLISLNSNKSYLSSFNCPSMGSSDTIYWPETSTYLRLPKFPTPLTYPHWSSGVNKSLTPDNAGPLGHFCHSFHYFYHWFSSL